MAPPPTSSMTIWHVDILDIICDFPDRPSLKALRLVNSSVSDVATRHVFSYAVMGFREFRLDRLGRIANSERLASHVCCIDWDCAYYYDEDAPFDGSLFIRRGERQQCLKLNFSTDPKARRRQKRHVLNRYACLAAEERAILESGVAARLANAFRKLRNLEAIIFYPWLYPRTDEGHIYAREGFDVADYEPPPLKSMRRYQPQTPRSRQTIFFALLTRALGLAGTKLRWFRACMGDAGLLNQLRLEGLRWATMLISFDQLDSTELSEAANSFQNLRSLHIDMHGDVVKMIQSAQGQGNLRGLLRQLTALRLLMLNLWPIWQYPDRPQEMNITPISLEKFLGGVTYPYPRTIFLQGFWSEALEVCDVSSAHEETLTAVTLSNMKVGGAEDYPEHYDVPFCRVVTTLQDYPEMTATPAGWDRIVDACRRLPRLEALPLREVYPWPEAFGKRDMQKLTEMAMNGRPNKWKS